MSRLYPACEQRAEAGGEPSTPPPAAPSPLSASLRAPRTPCTAPVSTEKSVPLRILYEKYCECLTESNLIKVRGLLVEPASNSYVLAERDIYLENPEIKIRVRQGNPEISRGEGLGEAQSLKTPP